METQPRTAKRPRGRPRDLRADRAILDAALDAFVEDGYEGMSVEDVAERAGVAKATVYRRWPSKQELVIAAVDCLFEDRMQLRDTGDIHADLVRQLQQAHSFLTQTKAGQALPRMVREIAAGTPFGRAYLDNVMGPRVQGLKDALARAQERGELREDLDLDLAAAGVIGPMMFLRLTQRLQETAPDLPEHLATQVMQGMARSAEHPPRDDRLE